MGNKMRLGVGRNHHQRNAESGSREVSCRILRLQILGRDPVRLYSRHGLYVIVETSGFVVGEEEHRVLPNLTSHQGLDQFHVIDRAQLDWISGVLIASTLKAR